MRKASTRLLEQGIQAPSPALDLIPAETSTENLHWDRYIGRRHFIATKRIIGYECTAKFHRTCNRQSAGSTIA
jgi:hypothetical protein